MVSHLSLAIQLPMSGKGESGTSAAKMLHQLLGSLALGASIVITGGLTAHAATCIGTSGDDTLSCFDRGRLDGWFGRE